LGACAQPGAFSANAAKAAATTTTDTIVFIVISPDATSQEPAASSEEPEASSDYYRNRFPLTNTITSRAPKACA